MELYKLHRGDHFMLKEDPRIPPAAPEGRMGEVYRFSHVDGMYAPVHDSKGERHYFAAFTEVEPVEEEA